jgi:hypothetical protein
MERWLCWQAFAHQADTTKVGGQMRAIDPPGLTRCFRKVLPSRVASGAAYWQYVQCPAAPCSVWPADNRFVCRKQVRALQRVLRLLA